MTPAQTDNEVCLAAERIGLRVIKSNGRYTLQTLETGIIVRRGLSAKEVLAFAALAEIASMEQSS